MKVTVNNLKQLIPTLDWTPAELADKLSVIGHETELIGAEELDVTLTANRHDCRDSRYLAYDLAGVYGLPTVGDLITFELGTAIEVTIEQVNKILGSNLEFDSMKLLERLGFIVTKTTVTPPAFRDVATIADVAEEVVRLVGFDQLAVKLLAKEVSPPSLVYEQILALKYALQKAGLIETATSTFSATGVVKLKNPFTQAEPYLRPSLLTGLLKTLAKNPYLKRAAFFEIGQVFEPSEITKMAVIVAGYKNRSDWEAKLANIIGRAVTLSAVNPNEASAQETKQSQLYWIEVALSEIPPQTLHDSAKSVTLPRFKPISKYPPLTADFNIYQPMTDIQQIISQAYQHFGDRLLLAELIDVYGEMYTLRFMLQKMNSSFTQSEINETFQEISVFLKPYGKDKI